MKITFGRVQKEFEGQDETFVGQDNEGNHAEFYYCLDITEERNNQGMFTITDTCDRYMPFDFEQLDELYEVIHMLKMYRDDKINFENYWKKAWGVPE